MLHSRVILFGGTFEPPHIGHLMLARLALEQMEANEVWLIPSASPPHKEAVTLNYDVRRQMAQALVSDTPGLRVMGIEETLPRPSYTVETVLTCQSLYPDTEFLFLLGADSLAALPSWRRAQELSQCVAFVVAVRWGFPFAETYQRVKDQLPLLRATVMEMPIIDVSSSWLRARFLSGQPMCGLVPDKVLAIWSRHFQR